ncbi:MAG: hypothetical protein WAU91_19905 [Desulfatitalea sp.]
MSWDPGYPADLRQMLIQQFMLHEVQHHDLQAGNPYGQTPRAPVAHDLIDIYKCLHQGEFGVGHTIDHPEGFRQRLYQELIRGLDVEPVSEPAVENISADGRMLRINLRAVRHLCGDDANRVADELVRVCIQSAEVTRGSNAHFFEVLDQFRMLNQAGEIALAGHVFAFPSAMVNTFLSEVRELMRRIREVPVLSHSDSYRRLNRPSYRVVTQLVLEASPLAGILEK